MSSAQLLRCAAGVLVLAQTSSSRLSLSALTLSFRGCMALQTLLRCSEGAKKLPCLNRSAAGALRVPPLAQLRRSLSRTLSPTGERAGGEGGARALRLLDKGGCRSSRPSSPARGDPPRQAREAGAALRRRGERQPGWRATRRATREAGRSAGRSREHPDPRSGGGRPDRKPDRSEEGRGSDRDGRLPRGSAAGAGARRRRR